MVEEAQIVRVLLWFRGAVRFNLVWADRIAKDQRLGESPRRLVFPACFSCRQPLFVLLALFSPLLTASPPSTTPHPRQPIPITLQKKISQRGLPRLPRGLRSWWRRRGKEIPNGELQTDNKGHEKKHERGESNKKKTLNQTKSNSRIRKENSGSIGRDCLVRVEGCLVVSCFQDPNTY